MKNLSKYIFLIPLILFALTPVLWFLGKGPIIINGVDINFPLDPISWFERRFFVWNPISNGGVDFSSSTAGLFFHLVQIIPYKLGFNLTLVQNISLVFWFSLIVFSAYLFARIILPKKYLLQILFVVLYSFNIYMFNSWENIKVANLSLVAAIPLALSIVVLLHDKIISYKRAIFFSCLVGIVVSGAGINPSYFISFFLVLFLYFLADFLVHLKTDSIKSVVRNLVIVSIPIILINLFWILPTLNFILSNLSPSNSIDKLGFTNWVDSLSENTSLMNIFRVQGAWDWYAKDGITNQPLYIPYAINYFHKLPFLVFSFLLPALAFISFLFVTKNNRNLYAAFGLMLIVGVFLGVGTHLPTGIFFRWLIDHVPFFTLFRSPWYIFSPLVTLSSAGLICLLLYNFRISKISTSLNMVFISLVSVILIIGNLIYSYPQVTGKIFRPARADGFYINFPGYVNEAKNWVKDVSGRIIGYPDDEIESFSWGYRGIDSILNLLVDKETLFSPLNAPDSPVAILIKSFYQYLKKGQWHGAENLITKMDAAVLFEKRDQQSLAPPLPDKFQSFTSVSFGPWNFYQLQQTSGNQKINVISKSLFAYPYTPYSEGAKTISPLGQDSVILNPEDSVVAEIPALTKNSGRVILSHPSQGLVFNNFKLTPSILSNRLISRDMTKTQFDFTVPEDGIYQPILERYRLEDFGIDLSKELKIEIDNTDQVWKINKISDSYVYFQPIEFKRGKHIISILLIIKNLINGGEFEDGTKFERGGYGQGFEEFKIEETGGGKFLSILNINKADVSANFNINSFDPMGNYYVELKYRQIYGNNANVVISQNNSNTLVKAQVERLPNYPEWHVFSFFYEPVETQSEAKVILSAPFTADPLGTKILYDDLRVYKVFNNDLLFIKEVNSIPQSPVVEFQRRSPVLYEGIVKRSNTSHVLVFSENYSSLWQLQLLNMDGSKIDIKTPHFSANLYANAWYIEGIQDDYKFKIYYNPQNLFWIGLSISLITFIFSMLIFLINLRDKKNV